jgi:ATP-dependent metalloprotease
MGLFVFVFIATMIIKNINSRSLLDMYNFDMKKANDVPQRLSDVKGINEIIEEVENVIKMVKNPDKYTECGAKLHKGLLLFGQPGTGKTLLARAIAGEAQTNFIYCTGSDFDEMFVGVGAKRVRELFEEAKKNTPCIIFIDEIDSLLSKSRRFGSEGSSSRATINQLLAEMDGFEANDNILVIGATNHEDILDPAAVRPGRFDKKVHVPLPDINGRIEIFDYFLKKIPISDEITPKDLAQMTPGFTGAEIENLVNTSIAEAIHNGKEKAEKIDFEFARDRIMMGIERKKLSMTEKDRLNTAIHESGHAIACFFTPGARKLYKATIVARGGSLGATFMVPDESEMLSMSKEKVLAHIDVAMGGHVAERIFLGKENVTSGCGSDLKSATDIAYQAVRRFGMFGSDVGYMSTDKKENSEKYNAMVDIAVKKILDESYDRVVSLLQSKEKHIRDLSKNLYWFDYLDADEMEKVIQGKKIREKEKVRDWEGERYILKF